MGVMKRRNSSARHIAISAAVFVCLAVLAVGCGGGSVSREEVKEIDAVFREGTSSLSGTTTFVAALEDFDFENAAFYDNAVYAIGTSRDAARRLRASVEELLSRDYGGDLEELGEYMREYGDAALEAVAELDAVYDSLQDIMEAVEPILREEAAITQLEAPQSDAEWMERLERLDAALQLSTSELAGVDVPPLLAEYKAFFEELLATLHKMTVELMATVAGQAANVEMENNPDFIHMQEMLDDYLPMVVSMYDGLRITMIDPLVEKVELEINRLYLGEGDRSAVRGQ